jgi:F-type H+-transporting ATPase subunit b
MDVNLKVMLYQAINFIILMGILGFLFNKFIRPSMRKRSDEIKQAFEQIDEQKKDMESLKLHYNDQLKDVRRQAAAEIDKAIEEGKRIREDMHTQNAKEGAAMLEKARKEIEKEKQLAITHLQKEVASLSMLATKKIIGSTMNEETNTRLVNEFLNDLAKNPPKQ